jgi:DNA-binding MarR family transcriptional regulator
VTSADAAVDARALWLRLETLHAVTYFGPETQTAARAIGLDGFWIGYFALRAAPLGPVGPGIVDAAFANFAPAFVRRWIPAAWERTDPSSALDARTEGAAATLRRVAPDLDRAAPLVGPLLDRAIAAADPIARPLFAANRDVALPTDPVAALWQQATTLREHRGDGHVAALAAAGLSGLEAHVLIAADHGTDPVDLQRTRGWAAEDWAVAVATLEGRGLVRRSGTLTDAGRSLRTEIEATTDRLAAAPFATLDDAERTALADLLLPSARAVSRAGVLRYPNPIGLPPIA